MGRPINKRFFGRLAVADDAADLPLNDTQYNININCQVGSNAESALGYIIRQRSSSKFLVNDAKDGTKRSTAGSGTGNVGVCTLVNKADGALDADEMSIMGFLNTTGTGIRIKKLYNRTARDFSNNKYTWTVSDDSTSTSIILTAI